MSRLNKLCYILVKYENSKRKIFLNIEKVPTKVAEEKIENCSKRITSSCTNKINNKYKKNNKRNKWTNERL